MLDLDITLLATSALIGILMLILNRLYYKPIGQILEERETKIANENGQIETMAKEIEEKTLHIEKVLKDTQKESRRIKEGLIKKGEVTREQIVTQAREESRVNFDDKMKELDQQLADAEKSLEKEIMVFSGKIKEIFIG